MASAFWITTTIVVIAIFLYQVFLMVEGASLFVPSSEYIWSPKDPEEINFGTRLHGWIFPNSKGPVVLFCHGNTGNISYRQYVIEICSEMGLSLFLFDYRGYGKSRGHSTLETLKSDGEEAYEYLRSRGYSSDEIIIWGESLGGLVASHIASRYRSRCLLLMATFSDLASLAGGNKSLLGKIVVPFLRFQDESNLHRMEMVTVPTLIIHSKEDEIIPYSHAKQLYASIYHPRKKLISVIGTHSRPLLTRHILETMREYIGYDLKITPRCLEILDRLYSGN